MSLEMNAMTVAMPTASQKPTEVSVCCFEATAANIATLRQLKAKATSGQTVTAEALMQAGVKSYSTTARLTTTVKKIRAEVEDRESTATAANNVRLNVFALARNPMSASTAEPLIALVDDLTVEDILGCPQIGVQHGSASTEVCVGESADENSSVSSSSTSSSSPTLVLFYARDTTLGCTGCCLCACLTAFCATVLCCCCVS